MKVVYINSTTDLKSISFAGAAALGNFDGVHIGHQMILKNCVTSAKKTNLSAAAVTFSPHPKCVLSINNPYKHLSTLEEKIDYMRKCGIEIVFIIKFDQQFSTLTPSQFASIYLRDMLQIKNLFTGYNFYFGCNRSGNTEWLNIHAEEYGFTYQAIGEVSYKHHIVSSSNIKKSLQLGAVGTAAKLLGRHFSITGKVVKGKGLAGPTLQLPTANIEIDACMSLPLLGVYLVKSTYNGQEMFGVANIGIRPSLGEACLPLLEVHFFDKDINLYDCALTIEFIQLLRPERRFNELESLRDQIHMDVKVGKYVLSNIEL